jgi:hypothetical protein
MSLKYNAWRSAKRTQNSTSCVYVLIHRFKFPAELVCLTFMSVSRSLWRLQHRTPKSNTEFSLQGTGILLTGRRGTQGYETAKFPHFFLDSRLTVGVPLQICTETTASKAMSTHCGKVSG